MQKITAFISQKRALPVIALAGLLLLILIVKLQPSIEHNVVERPSVPVSYIELSAQQIKPAVVGFGQIEPDLALKAKSEVTGRVIYIHPELKKGEIFSKNTLLIQIDDKDYILQIKQAEADLLANKASFTEMQLSIENNKLELELANEKLAVRKQEFSRSQKLLKKGLISKASFNNEKQNLLQQKQEVLKLNNQQTTLPSQLAVMQAKVDIAQFTLQKSQRDLERTQIKIPFNGRISQVYVELDQAIIKSASLFDAFALNKVIINAQFPLDQFSLFAKNFSQNNGKASIDIANNNIQGSNFKKLLVAAKLTATVEEVGGKFKPWQGKVERFSDNLDPQSMTIGVIISVTGSYENIQPGRKPPLLQGMHMKVSLQGQAKTFIAVPRFAMQKNNIYLISKDNTLQRLQINDRQTNGALILLNKGEINDNAKLITSDVFPAVDGMSVTPMIDNESQQQMQKWLAEETVSGNAQ